MNAVVENGWSSLLLAVGKGHSACVNLLLSAGADVNAVGRDGLSYLTRAIYHHGSSTCIQILLDVGAYVNAVGANGKNALQLATEKGATEIVELLKAAGAVHPQTE